MIYSGLHRIGANGFLPATLNKLEYGWQDRNNNDSNNHQAEIFFNKGQVAKEIAQKDKDACP
jgi:hypothetical protein